VNAVHHFGAHFSGAGINADGLAGNAGFGKRRRHPIGRPRLLRAGLEDQADLHGDDRQPERMHARRIARQHHAEHRAMTPVRQRMNRPQLGDLLENRGGQAQPFIADAKHEPRRGIRLAGRGFAQRLRCLAMQDLLSDRGIGGARQRSRRAQARRRFNCPG